MNNTSGSRGGGFRRILRAPKALLRRSYRFLRAHPSLIPFPLLNAGWHSLRVAARVLPEGSAPWRSVLSVWKSCNGRLNELEDTARREKICSLPPRLTLETTIHCNLRCPMCYRSHVDQTPDEIDRLPDMSPELFNRIAEQLFPTAKTVNLSLGGEPFMVKNLDAILDTVEKYGVKLDVVTNGMLLQRKGLLDRLPRLLARIEVSIDSLVPEEFEEIRYPAKYDRVMANFQELARHRREMGNNSFLLGVSFTAMRKNIRQLPEIIRFVAEAGGTHVRVTPLTIFEEEDRGKSLVTEPVLYNEVHVEARRAVEETGVDLQAHGPFIEADPAEAPGRGTCHDLYQNTFINFAGVVRTCCVFNPPASGSLTDHSFRKLWNSDFMRRMRRTYDTPEAHDACKHCYVVNIAADTVENRREQEFLFLREKPERKEPVAASEDESSKEEKK